MLLRNFLRTSLFGLARKLFWRARQASQVFSERKLRSTVVKISDNFSVFRRNSGCPSTDHRPPNADTDQLVVDVVQLVLYGMPLDELPEEEMLTVVICLQHQQASSASFSSN